MVYAIVLAGGKGTRMGNIGIPKQFLTINDKPIVIHTLEKYNEIKSIDKIILVCNTEYFEYSRNLMLEYKLDKNVHLVRGGNNRIESLLNGINSILENEIVNDDDIFISTDSVRPIINNNNIEELIIKARKYGAASIVNKITENIVKVNDNFEIEEVFPRHNLFKDLSPQAFNIKKFKKCIDKIDDLKKSTITDLSEILLLCKEKIIAIEGESNNIKITKPIDMKIVNELIKEENKLS